MLKAYKLDEQQHLLPLEDEAIPALMASALWVDLIDPTDEERDQVEASFRRPLPETEDVEEIEASSRFFEDEGGLHINTLFLHEVDNQPRNTSVAFTVSGGRLATLRERDIPAFRLLRMRVRREAGLAQDAMPLLLTLFLIKIDSLADTLEEVYTGLERVSALVLEDDGTDIERALDALARNEDTNGKVRLCLMDSQRALTFLLRRGRLAPGHAEQAHALLADIDSLLPHNTFVFDKINFLMDAALGFINIEQNQIIKIFSIAAVVFLPPTLVASIYGMNFEYMPELKWLLGYPGAIGLMLASGIAPYWYFKRKGWL